MLYNEAVKNENPNAILPYTEEDIQTIETEHSPTQTGMMKHSKECTGNIP